jgi:hypothetical protein
MKILAKDASAVSAFAQLRINDHAVDITCLASPDHSAHDASTVFCT